MVKYSTTRAQRQSVGRLSSARSFLPRPARCIRRVSFRAASAACTPLIVRETPQRECQSVPRKSSRRFVSFRETFHEFPISGCLEKTVLGDIILTCRLYPILVALCLSMIARRAAFHGHRLVAGMETCPVYGSLSCGSGNICFKATLDVELSRD